MDSNSFTAFSYSSPEVDLWTESPLKTVNNKKFRTLYILKH